MISILDQSIRLKGVDSVVCLDICINGQDDWTNFRLYDISRSGWYTIFHIGKKRKEVWYKKKKVKLSRISDKKRKKDIKQEKSKGTSISDKFGRSLEMHKKLVFKSDKNLWGFNMIKSLGQGMKLSLKLLGVWSTLSFP